MGAETYAPATSVHQGTDFVPATIEPGSTAGIADHLATYHSAPGQAKALVLEAAAGELPDPVKWRGHLVRVTDGEARTLAISDGASWHTLAAESAS
ncbi:hypothetical protein SAMN06297251_10630 [Fulvimarina manganoxydans]|uniref:Uncharacterized protein n=1 Tax=Fulvimarina manganoxydans TaxID=937218 RepID=A0A1W2BBS8_9HYPH|nr:hypothetical protein [Fulvimarina manganoxydans]SMC70294.1 hypothetical protein SAMN06297251_10630 [Fulvimarina manganoxydans]